MLASMGDRYRCAACGNLTRFDVVRTSRTRAFHHYSVAGDLTIEDEEVLDERIEAVTREPPGAGLGSWPEYRPPNCASAQRRSECHQPAR